MITKIELNKIATYTSPTILETDKSINLVYGLNGTGKSTLSNFLYEPDNENYSNCKIAGLNNEQILVYNLNFIKNNFYESDTLQGIFTLSEKNKDIEQKIANKIKELKKTQEDKVSTESKKTVEEIELEATTKNTQDTVWEIKTNYSGGDRILEFCLGGYKVKKNLFQHLLSITKPDSEPQQTIENLKKQTELLQGDKATTYETIPNISVDFNDIEKDELLEKKIEGNNNSKINDLIKKLNHSDWVKNGLEYLPEPPLPENETCPFCQNKTITNELIEEINKCFDKTYNNDVDSIAKLLEEYKNKINTISSFEKYRDIPFFSEKNNDFSLLRDSLNAVTSKNITLLNEKQKNPSKVINLDSTSKLLEDTNVLINSINENIKLHNESFSKKQETLDEIKKEFWEIMKWKYDQTITLYNQSIKKISQQIETFSKAIQKYEQDITQIQIDIATLQKDTVNIDSAISSINHNLASLGILGFHIENHEDNKYKLARESEYDDTFESLSEGEKMIISFLYFIELCKGKTDTENTVLDKIVVIDDPVSSLSHVYVFNVARFIEQEFYENENITQLFVLTHSLYFFYELTYKNPTKRHDKQKLFRLIKVKNSSSIEKLGYSDIQNDYQAYWHIVKEPSQSPQLIANCMRNIIEYYFNFVEGCEFQNLLQKDSIKDNKYHAFVRYMNRESHSDSTNIYDFKEFDYEIFKEAFALVFIKNGHEKHYNRMIK
jgi:wobble nucleotide-excising tRNase